MSLIVASVIASLFSALFINAAVAEPRETKFYPVALAAYFGALAFGALYVFFTH